MFTTIKGIIEIMALEQGKLQDCDIWIGRNHIRHATAVMLVEDNVLCFHGKQEDCSYTVTYATDKKIIFAHSIEEAKADKKLITEEINAKKNKEDEIITHNILSQFATLSRKLSECDCGIQHNIAKAIKNDEQYKPLRDFLRFPLGFNDQFNDDMMLEVTEIFQKQRIRFADFDNSNLITIIPLANITSVERNLIHCDKECVGIHTADQHVYYIYEEKYHDLYYALNYLYT